MKAAPTWLADFQRRFGDAIRTPLDRSSGTLAAEPAAYDDALVKIFGGQGTSTETRGASPSSESLG